MTSRVVLLGCGVCGKDSVLCKCRKQAPSRYYVVYCPRITRGEATHHLMARLFEDDTIVVDSAVEFVVKDFISGAEKFYRILHRPARGRRAQAKPRLVTEPREPGGHVR